jgi:hypothetical protein
MRLGVEYDSDWYNVVNIDYDTLNDLSDDLLHFYKGIDLEQLEVKPWTNF